MTRTLLRLLSAAREIADLRRPGGRGARMESKSAGVPGLAAATLAEASRDARCLSTLLISVQEDERQRIAFDLHDGIGQSLSLLKLSVEKSARLLRQGAVREAEQTLRELSPSIDEALSEVRRVAMELCPPMLEDLGLLPTLSWFFREFEATGIKVIRTISVTEDEMPRQLHIPVFRILQEALHNVTKHAKAQSVHVRLERVDGAVRLSIQDDGCGFEPDAVPWGERKGSGLGLLSMRQRATNSGASYHLDSAPGRGTTISIAWYTDPHP